MGRPGYLALCRLPGSEEQARHLASLTVIVDADSRWRRVGSTDHFTIWTIDPPRRTGFVSGPSEMIIGDLFDRQGAPIQDAAVCSHRDRADAVARRLCRESWGRYVALLPTPSGRTSVFRDASGSLEAYSWSLRSGLAVVTSTPIRLPTALQPPQLALNWEKIWRFLAAPAAFGDGSLFDGVRSIRPGEMTFAGDTARPGIQIWRPIDFVVNSRPDAGDAEEMVRRVDMCVAALVSGHDRVLMQLSGGLDSAIVASALAASGVSTRVVQWLNRFGDRPEGDERAFARAVAEHLGVEVTFAERKAIPIREEGLAELAGSFHPAMAGVDLSRDRDEADRLRDTGATAIVSGEGGDAAFFQMPSALVIADAVRGQGLGVLAGPLPGQIARRTRQPVWAVLRSALTALVGSPSPVRLNSPYVTDLPAAAVLRHPWVEEARGAKISPGKLLQVTAMSAAHMLPGESRRRQLAEHLYPLFAQPVMELCLSIPSPVLAGGSFDRPFARQAFTHRLPRPVRSRRAKGDLSSYYARLVARSLPALRPFLLDGALAEAGVLDRAKLDEALTVEQLIWGASPNQIMWAAATEAWVRHWQGRAGDSLSAPRNS